MFISYNNKIYKIKGFTLVELITVVIIIGILATIAIPSFNKATENAREREARTTLELIYNAQKMYRIDKGTYAANFTSLASYIDNPNNTADYYTYAITQAAANTFTATATRTGGTRKNFSINQSGAITELP